MTTTDQTPDAVRAAIAEVVASVQFAQVHHGVSILPDRCADAIYDRLAQIGALRPVGETIPLQATLLNGVLCLPDCVCGADLRLMGPHEARCETCGTRFQIAVSLIPGAAARAGDGAT